MDFPLLFISFLASMMTMKPFELTAAERLAEIARLLAGGLIRMRGRMSSQKSADCGEISLDILADESGPDPNIAGENRP
jgi:hypothetical protein